MKPRHAVALALVGWYLMVPPFHLDKTGVIDAVNDYAPISTWERLRSYDAIADCEADRRKNIEATKQMLGQRNLAGNLGALRILDAEDAQCIATNDPRLKGN